MSKESKTTYFYEGKTNNNNETIKFNSLVSKLQKKGILKNNFNLKYVEYKNLIQSRKNIELIKNILNIILNNQITDEITEFFVLIFLIVNFRNDIFIYKTNYEEYLYQKTLHLYNEFTKILNKFELNKNDDFLYLIQSYLTSYKTWLEEQKFNSFNSYLKIYKKYERNLAYIKKLEISTMNHFLEKYFEKMMDVTVESASKIIKEFKSYIDEFTVPNNNLEISLKILNDSIEEFYYTLGKEIKNKKYNFLKSILYDLEFITLKNIGSTYKKQVIEMFAIDEVILRLNNGNFLKKDFKKWIQNIFNIIKLPYLNNGIIIKIEDLDINICEKMELNFVIFVKYMYKIFDKYSKIKRQC